MTPGRRKAVHSDDGFSMAVVTLFQGVGDLGARHVLGIGGDRIFEVEDQAIGGKGSRFFRGHAGLNRAYRECCGAGVSLLSFKLAPCSPVQVVPDLV